MTKLILGGAQIGTSYGIREDETSVDHSQWKKILRHAGKRGFTAIDTAPTYGQSETAIGRAGWEGQVHTKLDPALPPTESMAASSYRLQRQILDVLYLFHAPPSNRKELLGARRVADSLESSVGMLGVSVYEPSEAEEFLSWESIRVVQFPINVFDRRFVALSESNDSKYLIGRSALLQGALSNPRGFGGPPDLEVSLLEFADLCHQFKKPPLKLALGWVLDQSWLDGLILGVNNLSQLMEILDVIESEPLSGEEIEALSSFSTPAWHDVDPRNWVR